MKSILTKAQHPHISKFDKVCLKCTPNGYDEHFHLQCSGLTCKIHPNEQQIVLVCKCCKKQFNSYSYLFHNTAKNPCPKFLILNKSKKSKIKLSKLFGQKYSINSILKCYCEDPTFPKDEYLNSYLLKLKETDNNSHMSTLIDNFFKIQDKLSHNKGKEEEKIINGENINKLTDKFSSSVSKLSDIISKTQRYNTRSRHGDINTEICSTLSKTDKTNIEETMNTLNDILDKENLRFKKRCEEMREYYSQLIQIAKPLIETTTYYRSIIAKQTRSFQSIYKENGLLYSSNSETEYMKVIEKKEEVNIEELKKKGMFSILDIDKSKQNDDEYYTSDDDNYNYNDLNSTYGNENNNNKSIASISNNSYNNQNYEINEDDEIEKKYHNTDHKTVTFAVDVKGKDPL